LAASLIEWRGPAARAAALISVRLQLHALAYNLGNFLRTLATPEPIKDWSLTSLNDAGFKRYFVVSIAGWADAFELRNPSLSFDAPFAAVPRDHRRSHR